jgi:hypothetical protein
MGPHGKDRKKPSALGEQSRFPSGMTNKKDNSKSKSNGKYGVLSTARRTMKLSVASVEMTLSYAEQKNDALVEQKKGNSWASQKFMCAGRWERRLAVKLR